MPIPAIIAIAAKKIAKKAAINAAVNLVLKEKTDKLDLIMSVVSIPGSEYIKWFKKYKKVSKQVAKSIAKNQDIIRRLQRGEKIVNKTGGSARWSVKKATNNINRAMKAKGKFVKKSIKKAVIKKVTSIVPGKRIAMNVKDLAQAIMDKKSWRKITKKTSSLIGKMGGRDIQHIFGLVDQYSSLDLTVNMFWRRISDNHSANHPIIGTSGGASLRYVLQYKQKYQYQFFDREFWFNVNSPITGNFEQGLHSYDPTIKMYSLPIRGWGGTKIQRYFFYGEDTPSLSSVINLCTNSKTDFGTAIYKTYMHPTFKKKEELYYIAKDPYWNRIQFFISKKNKR